MKTLIKKVSENPVLAGELLAVEVMDWIPEINSDDVIYTYRDGQGNEVIAYKWNPAADLNNVAEVVKKLIQKDESAYMDYALALKPSDEEAKIDKTLFDVDADAPTRCAAIIRAYGLEKKFDEMINQRKKNDDE